MVSMSVCIPAPQCVSRIGFPGGGSAKHGVQVLDAAAIEAVAVLERLRVALRGPCVQHHATTVVTGVDQLPVQTDPADRESASRNQGNHFRIHEREPAFRYSSLAPPRCCTFAHRLAAACVTRAVSYCALYHSRPRVVHPSTRLRGGGGVLGRPSPHGLPCTGPAAGPM